ncbi:dTDP-4-dehydrorhamnose 3,5-epimerase [Falsiroseomonas sp. HW251]|uniref:dTDP-4-dehydrorhamnose 3,5-epimerase n=1 Tax=Falsiroseomonas sp. HW251 TaxID=3390998 RepID=UPI003D31EF2F
MSLAYATDGPSAPPRLRRAGNATAWTFPDMQGPLLVEVRRFGDPRGAFAETYSRRDFAALGIAEEFVQDNWSRSDPVGTLRGLHFQRPPHAQAKLVRVLRGAILDVAVDLRRSSPTYAQHVTVTLEEGDGRMLYVPAGFAHGFCTLRPGTEVAYKVDDCYAPECDGGVAWDDPDIGIDWPVGQASVVLSEKDARLPRLADLPRIFA